MSEAYILLQEHVIHSLTNTPNISLKEFAAKLIEKNEVPREEIIKAYDKINFELVGETNLQ